MQISADFREQATSSDTVFIWFAEFRHACTNLGDINRILLEHFRLQVKEKEFIFISTNNDKIQARKWQNDSDMNNGDEETKMIWKQKMKSIFSQVYSYLQMFGKIKVHS